MLLSGRFAAGHQGHNAVTENKQWAHEKKKQNGDKTDDVLVLLLSPSVGTAEVN